MDEGLLNDEKLKKSYNNLQKYIAQIKKDHPRLMDEDFTQTDWNSEGLKIEKNIRSYKKGLKDLKTNLDNAKDNGTANEYTISKIQDELEKIDDNVETMVQQMEDKIKEFDQPEVEMKEQEHNDEEEGGAQQQELVTELMDNQQILKQRRDQLQDIHKTAALIKETTDKMATDLNQQGEMLDNIEAHVVKTEDNVEKAGKEINKANEYSKGNTKRLCCIIIIIVVAVGVALAVVLSLVL